MTSAFFVICGAFRSGPIFSRNGRAFGFVGSPDGSRPESRVPSEVVG